MRGKQCESRVRKLHEGITPAHAGKTTVLIKAEALPEDHPRACGENFCRRSSALLLPGSPPRMRGKHYLALYSCSFARITPAHAGKTLTLRRSWKAERDHPRACGENEPALSMPLLSLGSPPRMRGKPEQCGLSRRGGRITPAHAGKTWSGPLLPHRKQDHPRACGENTSEMAYFRG